MTVNNEFTDFIESLPLRDVKNVKKAIIKECLITDVVFRNWLLGRTKVPPLAYAVIEKIANKKIFNVQK